MAGPHLVRGQLVAGSAGCRVQGSGEYDVVYESVLRVYGPAARDDWLMRMTFSDGSVGSGGSTTSRAVAGGREFVFTLAQPLDPPDHSPVAINGEYVIDATAGASDYTYLGYESGGVVITAKYCTG